MAKKPVSRKKLLKEPDEFITTMGKVIRFGTRYQKQITYGAVALLIVLVGISGYRYYDYNTTRKAYGMLSQTNAKYAQQMQVNENDPTAAQAAVKADYEAFLNSYDGTTAGQIGRVIYANLCYMAQQYDEALPHYKKSLETFANDPFYGPMVRTNLGLTLLAKGDLDSARSYFQQTTDTDPAPLTAEALFHAALIAQAQDNDTEAAAMFEKIVTDFPDSAYVPMAKEAGRG